MTIEIHPRMATFIAKIEQQTGTKVSDEVIVVANAAYALGVSEGKQWAVDSLVKAVAQDI